MRGVGTLGTDLTMGVDLAVVDFEGDSCALTEGDGADVAADERRLLKWEVATSRLEARERSMVRR